MNIGEYCIKNKITISTAESCTGGLISGFITNTPGISEVLSHSFVTYSNESKMKFLNVKKETIEKYDVVSEEVAIEMVMGLNEESGSDLCISSTGYLHKYAEELGNNEIYCAVKYKDKLMTIQYSLQLLRNSSRRYIIKSLNDLVCDFLYFVCRCHQDITHFCNLKENSRIRLIKIYDIKDGVLEIAS